MSSTELEPFGGEVLPAPAPATSLIPADTPAAFLDRAGEVAQALVDVVEKRGLFTQVGRKKHIHVDAWTSLGSLLGSVGGKGVFAVPDGPPEAIEINGVQGVMARMKAVTLDGQIVGGATGFCMRDEPTWAKRPFYALAGMAETRATSRALRKPLGFIVELAGYAATAAEEMPRDGEVIEDAEIVQDPAGNVFPDQRPGAGSAAYMAKAQELLEVCGKLDGCDLAEVNRLLAEHDGDTGWVTRQIKTAKARLKQQEKS